MLEQLNTLSSAIKQTAHQLGRLNGPGFEIEKPLHARMKVELDRFILSVKGRFSALEVQLASLRSRVQDVQHQQAKKQQWRAELPVSKLWSWFLLFLVAVGVLGEVFFINSTVADGLNMDSDHGYAVSLAIIVALLPLEWLLGKWFLSKSNMAQHHTHYPKKTIVLVGILMFVSALAMYGAIGVFRAEVFSWNENYAFDLFVQDKPLVAYSIVATITLGMFMGLPFAMGMVDANFKSLLLDKSLKKLAIKEDYLIKQVQQVQLEYTSLQNLIQDWDSIKINTLQAWMVDAHVAYMEGIQSFLQEQEQAQAQVGQLQQPTEPISQLGARSLSELTQALFGHELHQQLVDIQKQRTLNQLGEGMKPINYMNGYAKHITPENE